jgi:hypothetical protein
MSFFINYLYSLTETSSVNKPVAQPILSKSYQTTNLDDDFSIVDKKYLISKDDLIKVNLKPVIDVIPNPSRNMPPMDKFNLRDLNKAQMNMILNVKLKPAIVNQKPVYYAPKHPVLRELVEKFSFKSLS